MLIIFARSIPIWLAWSALIKNGITIRDLMRRSIVAVVVITKSADEYDQWGSQARPRPWEVMLVAQPFAASMRDPTRTRDSDKKTAPNGAVFLNLSSTLSYASFFARRSTFSAIRADFPRRSRR